MKPSATKAPLARTPDHQHRRLNLPRSSSQPALKSGAERLRRAWCVGPVPALGDKPIHCWQEAASRPHAEPGRLTQSAIGRYGAEPADIGTHVVADIAMAGAQRMTAASLVTRLIVAVSQGALPGRCRVKARLPTQPRGRSSTQRRASLELTAMRMRTVIAVLIKTR